MDRQCAPCPFRTFSATAGTKCKYWKTCRLPEVELVAPTATRDRVCGIPPPLVCLACDYLAGGICSDLSALQECVLVDGTLVSFGTTATTISNPYLTLALGDFAIFGSSSIRVIEFPALTEVRGAAGFLELTVITTLDLPALTYAMGFVVVDNNILPRLILPELRIVEYSSGLVLSLRVDSNNMLTYLSVPKLTFVELIRICENGVGFIVPNAMDMTAPVGGLVVTGPRKGTGICNIWDGRGECSLVTCP
jgi:hypothetical protein